MELFWQRGYEASSIQDLVDHMGIGRGSMYDTFGSKHDLYLAALERYQQVSHQLFAPLDEPEAGRSAIVRVFDNLVDVAVQDPHRRGCFMANSIVELAPHDPKTAECACNALAGMEEAFHRVLVRAQQAGEIGRTRDARVLARFLVNAVLGIRVLAKGNPNRELLQDVVTATLSALD